MGLHNEISVELSEFVENMSRSVAEAKRHTDKASLDALTELANTKLKIPIVTKHIEDDVIHYTSEEVEVSPLSLGLMPTFYEFQKTNIEVALDFEITEDKTTSETDKNKFSRIGQIGISTKRVRQERKFKSDFKGYSTLKIEMVPVPPPNNLPEFIVDDSDET